MNVYVYYWAEEDIDNDTGIQCDEFENACMTYTGTRLVILNAEDEEIAIYSDFKRAYAKETIYRIDAQKE